MTTSSRYLELRVVHGPSSPSVPTRSPTPTTRLLDVTPTFPSHPSLPTHPNSSIELSEPQASKRIQVLSKNFHSSIAHHHLFSSDTITRLSISQAHLKSPYVVSTAFRNDNEPYVSLIINLDSCPSHRCTT